MIELKNINKMYISKSSTITQALNNVSLKFPEKGMIFIVGKSGSGKSTLLNIIGGLDKYDSGEMIVDGKSTKRFTEADFDAYRNTYVGFIFQEYNLLENYSVEKNIKLPLELQHQKVSDEDVKQALETVDLYDVAKRKPNELSGGQKQRVAIARALIKKPKVILADEPTGNLDSQTSEQIWKILKDISKEQLVIAVSHDTVAANEYADKIINIQDGQAFAEYDNETEEETDNQELNLKKAKLPFFYSFKMGVGSLFHKKIRLILSCILISFSLICFGVMISASSININEQYVNFFEENGSSSNIYLHKYNKVVNYIERSKNEVTNNLTNDDNYSVVELDGAIIEEARAKTGLDWKEVYNIDGNGTNMYFEYVDSLKNETDMSLYYFCGQDISEFNFVVSTTTLENLIGVMPQNDNEIVISSYIADMIIYQGIYAKSSDDENAEDVTFKPENYEEILSSNMYINLGNLLNVKIVGIIDYNDEIAENYAKLKDVITKDILTSSSGTYTDDERTEISNLRTEFYVHIEDEYSKVYVSQDFISRVQNIGGTYTNVSFKYNYNNSELDDYGETIMYIDESLDIVTESGIQTITSLEDNEIVISGGALLDTITNNYTSSYYDNINRYASIEEFLKEFVKSNEIIGQTLRININNGELVSDEEDYVEYTIVGVILEDFDENYTAKICFNQDVVDTLVTGIVHLNTAMVKVNSSEELNTILKYYPIDKSDILSSSVYSEDVLDVAVISYFIEYIGKYGVIFFLIFATIILMNFINSSIRYRKKEIGIFRALGCSSSDVIKMFVYESLVLMIIALFIAFLIIPNILTSVNNFVETELISGITLLYFSTKQVFEITVIMLAIVLLANVIPLRKITKMKPIDAILNR